MAIMRLKKAREKRQIRVKKHFDRLQYAEDIGGLITSFRQWLVSLYQKIPELEQKLKDLPGTNYKLGVEYFKAGRFTDAVLRFRIVMWLEPRHVAAVFKAARCYHALGNKERGRELYRKALAMKPDYTEAQFMLSILDEQKLPAQRIPISLVVEQFDRLAPIYRSHYVDRMGYTGHLAMEKGVTDWVSAKIAGDDNPILARYDIMEIGCGCGVTGERLRIYARTSTGIDVSKNMIDMIPEQPPGRQQIYDKVLHEEAGACLTRQPHSTSDIIMAAGVFNYVGDLKDIIAPAAKVLRAGGLLAFTIERLPTDDAKQMPFAWHAQRGAFGHSLKYIRDLCASHGLKEFRVDEIMLYRNAPGYTCLFTKS